MRYYHGPRVTGALVLVGLLWGVAAYAQGVQVDPCENTAFWTAAGSPYGKVVVTAGPYAPKQGRKCLRMEFLDGQRSYVYFTPKVAWGDNDYLSFWLKAEGPKKHEGKLRLVAEASDTLSLDQVGENLTGWWPADGVFKIVRDIALDFDGWTRVRLSKEDFQFYIRDWLGAMDWAKIRGLSFVQMEGDDLAHYLH